MCSSNFFLVKFLFVFGSPVLPIAVSIDVDKKKKQNSRITLVIIVIMTVGVIVFECRSFVFTITRTG